jgi:hypothetical protein
MSPTADFAGLLTDLDVYCDPLARHPSPVTRHPSFTRQVIFLACSST